MKHLPGHDFIQPMDAGDSVSKGDDCAYLIHGNLGLVVFNLLTNELCDFVCFDLSHKIFFTLISSVQRSFDSRTSARSGSRQQAPATHAITRKIARAGDPATLTPA